MAKMCKAKAKKVRTQHSDRRVKKAKSCMAGFRDIERFTKAGTAGRAKMYNTKEAKRCRTKSMVPKDLRGKKSVYMRSGTNNAEGFTLHLRSSTHKKKSSKKGHATSAASYWKAMRG